MFFHGFKVHKVLNHLKSVPCTKGHLLPSKGEPSFGKVIEPILYALPKADYLVGTDRSSHQTAIHSLFVCSFKLVLR